MRKLLANPLLWLTMLGFGLPFIFQSGFYPFQKLSMFSEDPSAYQRLQSPPDTLKRL